MTGPNRRRLGDKAEYGYGFFIVGDYIVYLGEWDGFETEMAISQSKNIEYAILTNSGSIGRVHSEAIKHIIFTTPF